MNKYRSIIEDIKCSYCENAIDLCEKTCPEIKGINISNSDRRRVLNLSGDYTTFGTVIFNKNLKEDIVKRPA